MPPSWKHKVAGQLNISPELNRILVQSKKSWDEVSGLLVKPKKKTSKSSKN